MDETNREVDVSRAATTQPVLALVAGVLLALLAVLHIAPVASAHQADAIATQAEIVGRGGPELPDDAFPHAHTQWHEGETCDPKRPARGVQSQDPAASAVTSSSTRTALTCQAPRRLSGTLPAVLQVFRR
jgi:hypothetical protein